MSDDEVRVPAGLTTEGLLGVRYMARFIDSVFMVLAIGGVLGLVEAILTKPAAGGLAGVLFVLFNLSHTSQAGRPTPLQASGRTLVKDSALIWWCCTAVPCIGPFTTAPRTPGWPLRKGLPSFTSASAG